MVRFEKDRLVVEIETNYPDNMWCETIRSLLYMIGAADKECLNDDRNSLYWMSNLIMEMLPSEEDMMELMKAKGLR